MVYFTDAFTRADGALGDDYVTVSGLNSLSVFSNTARSGTGLQAANVVASGVAAFSADHECECVVAALGSFDYGGLLVRGDAAAANGYLVAFDGRSSTSGRIGRMTAGAVTPIGTVNVVPAANDVVRLRVEGSTVSVYVNDVLVDSVTDTTYASGQPGLYYRRENVGATRIDDFSAEDVVPPARIFLVFRPPV